jgi:LacI family sucrose operon transcriptional repressor
MATIKDVAREAGLAVGTVSRVLNNRGYISESARVKVREAMDKLDYQPNEMARSLQKKHSNMIGVIVPRIEHPYFAKLISCLEEAAYEQGNRLLLLNSKGIRDREHEYMELCRRNRVQGIILCNGNLDLERSGDINIPVVTIERKMEGGDASIECNNFEGGVLAAEHLIEKGCRRLLHIRGLADINMPADQRGEGFETACLQHGIKPEIIHAPLLEYQLENPEDFFKNSMDRIKESDGVFLSDDLLAVRLMHACWTAGIRIPEDLKVVGFDDVHFSSYVTPSLTTIRQPLREMAGEAIRLAGLLNRKEPVPKNTVFPVKLIARESSS